MSTEIHVRDSIEQAADAVGSVWPLHSFVTANPLAGFEDRPFHEAVEAGKRLRDGDGYPSAAVFRSAWESGQIDPEALHTELAEHGYRGEPEALLDRMAAEETADTADDADDAETPTDHVDRVLTKWLAVFFDQGKAHWSMPGREQGFYTAVRRLARHDSRIPDAGQLADLPDDSVAAVETLLADHPTAEWPTVFEYQLSALPGWTGFLKQRIEADDDWQAENPVTLAGYLAVRLALADLFDAPILPPADESAATDESDEHEVPLAEVWLSAWEATYRNELVGAVEDASASAVDEDDSGRPDAQFVFCIDTRSEVIRRHIEATGDYDTHGYAGFFGIPMRHSAYDADVTVDACPPIVDAAHRIADRPTGDHDEAHHSHDRWTGLLDAGRETLESLKGNAATAFSLVETAGAGYGVALAARTLVPDRVYDVLDAADERIPANRTFCEPSVDYNPDSVNELREGLTLDEKVAYAESAFDLMGWEQFARVVVFAGHASQTANNPFGSSLDCGACAGNPGGPNARVLATICNDEAVKAELRERGHDIPDDTVFVAGEHNTMTDEVELFADGVPASHVDDVEALRADLEAARAGAATERVGSDGDTENPVREATRRAADWAETRPEWGLAGNAGFVVGPRSLTDGLDLDGRAFLHSYDWTTDPDGDALEAIVTGPLVVTQWINSQYYFATVDNAAYGSGSKVTHNPVGNVGVYQGNGGDLMTGLPLQSLMSADDDPYHQPLRLSTVLHAPVDRVTEILADHPEVAGLLDNGWLSLTVVDPTQDHRGFHYEGELEWRPTAPKSATEPVSEPTSERPAPIAADD